MPIEVIPTLSEIRHFQIHGKQPDSLKKRVKEAEEKNKKLLKATKKFEDLKTEDFIEKLKEVTNKEVVQELLNQEFAGESRESVIAALTRKANSTEVESVAPEPEEEEEINLSEMTVDEIEEDLKNEDNYDTLIQWLEIEKAGKNRTSAVNAIKSRIKEVGSDMWPRQVEGGFWETSEGKKFPPDEKEKAVEEQSKIDLM